MAARRRRASRKRHARNGAATSAARTREEARKATVETGPHVEDRAREDAPVGERRGRFPALLSRRDGRHVEVPGRIARERPARGDLVGGGRRRRLAREATTGNVSQDPELAGQGPRGRGADGETSREYEEGDPKHRHRRPARGESQAEAAVRRQEPARREGHHPRPEQQEHLGVSEPGHGRGDDCDRGEAPGPLDHRPVGEPQREEGEGKGPRLRAVGEELALQADRGEQQARAKDGHPGRGDAAQEQGGRGQGSTKEGEAVGLENEPHVEIREQGEGGGRVRGHRQVVGLERAQRPPLRQGRGKPTVQRSLAGEVRVVPDRGAERQERVADGRARREHDEHRGDGHPRRADSKREIPPRTRPASRRTNGSRGGATAGRQQERDEGHRPEDEDQRQRRHEPGGCQDGARDGGHQ